MALYAMILKLKLIVFLGLYTSINWSLLMYSLHLGDNRSFFLLVPLILSF